jgi:transmembrane sensor
MEATERRQRTAAEAADWFVRLQSDPSREERALFVAWLQESHIHVAELIRVARVHGALGQFERWARVASRPAPPADNIVALPARGDASAPGATARIEVDELDERRLPALSRPKVRKPTLYLAAAAIVLVAFAFVLVPKLRGQIIETDRGERREVVLDDGSLVQVDPETRLRVKYSTSVRTVFLEHGRALFHVAKNPNRPFFVHAEDTVVRAVGTAFGVERQSQDVVVTVVEGKVAVTSERLASQSAPSSQLGKELPTIAGGAGTSSEILDRGPIVLVTDQQVILKRGGSIEPVRRVDSQRELAWAEGRLIFRDDNLAKVVAQFNRYNHVQIRIADPALAVQTISGVFNAAEPGSFIEFLRAAARVDIARQGDDSITISSHSKD